MEDKASLTALVSLFGRVYHAECDKPIVFDDALGRRLMTEEEYRGIKGYMLKGIEFFAPEKKESFKSAGDMLKWIVQTQIAPTPLARARYCEDTLKVAVLTGATQYVILGAGMDTFGFRNLALMKQLHVFEVDHPLTQQEKKRRIFQAGWDVPDKLHFVPVDFTKGNLTDILLEHGYKKGEKTFFSWLGSSYYLTKEQMEAILTSIHSFAAEGSSLLFDFAAEGLFQCPVKRVQNMIAMAAAGGEPMKSCFSYDELEKILSKHGFLIYELLETRDIQNRYFANRKDYLSAFECIHYALAVLK